MIIPFGKKTWFDLDLIKCNIMPCLNTYAYKIWTHCTLRQQSSAQTTDDNFLNWGQNKMNCELMLTYDTPAYMFNVY
jgi:hypothetical protein